MGYYYVRSKNVRFWNYDVGSENRRRRYGEKPGRVDNVSLSIKINTYRIDPSRVFVKAAILFNIIHCFGLEEPIIKEIEQNQFTWYGHIQRMAER